MKNKINLYHPTIGFGEIDENIAHIGLQEKELVRGERGTVLHRNTRIYMSNGKTFLVGVDECPVPNAYTEKKPIHIDQFNGDEPDDQMSLFVSGGKSILNIKSDVYDLLVNELDKSIDFYNSDDKYIVAIWAIGTYFFSVFQTYPYLVLSGSRGSGKTKVLDFLNCVVFNPVKCGNTSVSSLFRLIDSGRSTILLDEAEMLKNSEEAGDLKRILNMGYKSDGVVMRTNKDNAMAVETFQTYSPKAIASINKVDETLSSRGITITMIKTGDKKKGNVVIRKDGWIWGVLRDRLRVLFLILASEANKIYRNDNEINQLSCRKNELWSTLLVIARLVGDDAFTKLKEIALKTTGEEEQVIDEWDTHFLFSLKDLLVSGDGFYFGKEIKAKMESRMEPDQAYKLTSRWVGEAIRRFGFVTKTRTATGYKYMIKKSLVDDLMSRYQLGVASSEHDEGDELILADEQWANEAIPIFSNQ